MITIQLTEDEADKLVDILNILIYMPMTYMDITHTETAAAVKSRFPEPYCQKDTNGYWDGTLGKCSPKPI